MNVKDILDKVGEISFCSVETAGDLRVKSIKQDGTWFQALGARALFVAQLIISIVAVPLLFLGSLLGASFALCFGEEGDTWKMLKGMSLLGVVNLSMIPTSLIATFAPHSWNWVSPAKDVSECLDVY